MARWSGAKPQLVKHLSQAVTPGLHCTGHQHTCHLRQDHDDNHRQYKQRPQPESHWACWFILVKFENVYFACTVKKSATCNMTHENWEGRQSRAGQWKRFTVMKTKVRLCKLLFSTRLLVSLLIFLGILECLHWLQGVGEGFPGSKDLILADYPELSSMKSSSNFHSSSHLPEKSAPPSSSPIQTESNPRKKSPPVRQNILLLAYARSGKNIFHIHTLHIKG